MYNDFRKRFPEETAKSDVEHIRYWGEIDPEYAYSWFESLAKAMNQDMENSIPSTEYKEILEFLRKRFVSGDEEEKKCLDVSFVENLFWRVSVGNAKPYWNSLPEIFKKLYKDFHRREPI